LIVDVDGRADASGRWGAERLLEGTTFRCTAVVAGTDRNSAGAMEVLQAAGLRIPEDVAVVGFDDLAFAALSDPPLATLRTRCDELGSRAALLLLDEMDMGVGPRCRDDLLVRRDV
jgi:DNA-binding LacI/PurR family transcriptional regulator